MQHKKWLAVALCALGISGAVQAADEVGKVRPLVGIGITAGGETLVKVTYTDGSTGEINAGGLFALYGGLDYRVSQTFSVQGTINYHVDSVNGSNGSLEFTRVPLELLGYYHVSDTWRVGGGLRYVTNPKVRGTGVVGNINGDFDNTMGAVLEGEYFLSKNAGLKLRAVKETYTLKGTSTTYRGDHVGAYISYYF